MKRYQQCRTPIDVGPLDPLLADPAITAIYLDEAGVRFTKDGITQFSAVDFVNSDHRRQVIENMLAACGETLSSDHDRVDCVLADGTRVHAEYAPLAVSLTKPAKPFSST
jgi:Flp pilus assembly CpaF family ATPase